MSVRTPHAPGGKSATLEDMAEDHRRVEPRSIVGTGMATDPERVEQVADEAARRERANRAPPAQSFRDVLVSAPARGEFEDAPGRDPRRKPDSERKDVSEATSTTETSTPSMPTLTPAAPAATSTAPAPALAASSKPRPSLPDPRERLLREKLARSQAAAAKAIVPDPPGVTPPTGSSRIKR